MMYEKRNSYDVTLETVNFFKGKLNSLKDFIPKNKCFLGWDGFVDNLYSVIQSRESMELWSSINTMKIFGELIKSVAGNSVGIECILKRKTTGGFTSNVCKGLSTLGVKMYLASAWGYPNLVDIFNSLVSKDSIKVNSFTNPGYTIGLEFNDGKIMLNDIESILKINWNIITERIGIEDLAQKFDLCNLIGLGYWAIILQFEDILQHILTDILPSIKEAKKKLLFLDLADVKRRTKKDLINFLKFIPKIDEHLPLLLSLNDQEAKDILMALKEEDLLKLNKKSEAELVDAGIYINEILNISYVVIHSPHFATITTKNKHYWITEGYTSNPKYITSAGDHFNAGTVLGLACKLSPAEAILMGNVVTAIFVRTGNSPNFQELTQFIRKYIDYIEKDNPDFP